MIEETKRALYATAALLLEPVGLELPSHCITGIDFGVVTPLFRQIIQRKDCCNRADGYTRTTIDTLDGIDVQLLDFLKAGTVVIIGRILFRVNAVDRTRINTRRVLRSDTGLCNYKCHKYPRLQVCFRSNSRSSQTST